MATGSRPNRSGTATFGIDWLSVALALGGVLLLYYVVPLMSLFLSVPAGDVLARMSDPSVVDSATTSLLSASISTAVAALFGLPLAYWLARTDGAVTKAVLAVVVLPLVLPPTVGGIVLLTVFGPGSALGDAASAVGVPLTRSLAGVVLAQIFVASPFVVVTAKAAFESVDRRLEYASRSLGKSRSTTARHVTLPLAGPGIIAGVTLAFARAIGEFGATMMMAYYPRTMPVQIWVAFIELGLDNAYPVAILLVVIAAAALLILNTVASNPWE
ncbi:ABC-type transport system permease protein (probable substrate sulfate/thiosulfate/molybdate) [Natronomonas moolapensis 8.8.11]|uniref:ABC-type transport system permease protein (Probable substrate sulfate/thiosulfate/molybdate) n=1 Tax=Natronomonas moolapensis (strain DSM 18674 / CECT 7526 / JCM 14361 / 8.8.11) TaxID=268739 RepID=M1XYY3_NATM8|nr:ABC transporter permease subunit [Natronomonas moolapensis]CCQ35348.1 ABC-type transport system permease protein (probable substrate sulfate/thiosulfate/molybdate) [Natronomonas moolapensis 8.8.11]